MKNREWKRGYENFVLEKISHTFKSTTISCSAEVQTPSTSAELVFKSTIIG